MNDGTTRAHSSRRSFLAAAGVGTAVGAAAMTMPASASAAPIDSTALPKGATGSMAAYIHDLTKGEVALMVEGHEVILTDKKLVASLARAFAQAQKA